ncbi:MAG: four helix bundle protein [Candidatus Blackburnbacteria bacterium RIFCSPLOWO2_01_FULL_41_27]|uniref:Four helix bundle protein n=2 Tax=Candidatus Blackburniibacteriota TaxID=1817898 RepID=A0A1G1V6S4_9BACT|nr:MAG: four helix bundle protein [Candidatus Blackburnbacteria bacterium RIFCSPHIGHO2_12_FULL_41_13b]OGY13693.1 MAG: four helix bundle protein [Candidatus Blackburnbacteria bacterium RIFCSPLOWO2_01_FULL_41_27]
MLETNSIQPKIYDLEERTAIFGERIIDLCKKAPKGSVTNRIVDQLIGAGTGTGGNYQEANGASSKKDFRNKIFICKKEAKEAQYWLRMLARACEELKVECKELWSEAQELIMIFSKIAKSSG